MTDLWTGGIGFGDGRDSRILTGGIRGRWDRTLNNARMDAALDFITSGNFDRVNAYGIGVFDTGGGANNLNPSRCRTSSDCGIGYMCVDGACRRSSSTGTSTGSGTSNGRTDASCPPDPSPDGDPSPPAPGGGNCSGGSGGGGGGTVAGPCSKPSCGGTTASGGGGGGGGADCCGARCCRTIGGQQTFSVQCFCGECPPPGRCQEWCDSYYKSNGRQAEGCSDAKTCSECENCVSDAYGAKCVPASSGVPCWCEGNTGCGECEKCQEDGTCLYDCANCQTCYTQYNVPCSCGYFNIQCCVSTCNENSISHASCSVAGCKKACGDPPSPDPCAPQCANKTVCGDPGSGIPDCPPGYSSTGTITTHHDGGDVSCRLCEKCKLPPECEPCDCNCEDDCPDCQTCNAEGKCVRDPVCDKCNEGQTLCADLETCCLEGSHCVSIYSNIFQTTASGITANYLSVGPISYGFVSGNGEDKICNSCNPTRPRLVMSNSSLIESLQCSGGHTRYICYYDPVCFGVDAFTPVLIDSYIQSVRCCPNN